MEASFHKEKPTLASIRTGITLTLDYSLTAHAFLLFDWQKKER